MSPTKHRVRFENISNTPLDGKASKEEVTADSESESDEVVFGVVKNVYIPKRDDELGTIGSMFNNDEDTQKKKSIRGVVIGMVLLTKQILNPRKLLKNDVNDRNGGKLGRNSQRRGTGAKACASTMLLNADAWRNSNPMINLDLSHNAFASRPKDNKSKNIRKASPKTNTETFTTPSRQDLSSSNKINKSDTSRNSIGSTMSISTASLSPQSSVTSKRTSRLNVSTGSISPGIVPRQCNLNLSNHGYNLSMSSSDNEDDDYSVDEDVEDIVSVAMSNQYQPDRGFRSSSEEEEIHTYCPNNKLNKRRSVTTRVKTNTPSKYMMYQFDNNDQSHINGMKHKNS